MLKETNATEDAPVETTLGVNLEEVVDVEITRIVKEKRSVSDDFDGSGGVHNMTSNDGDDEERAEV
jgi:hypothetical protein